MPIPDAITLEAELFKLPPLVVGVASQSILFTQEPTSGGYRCIVSCETGPHADPADAYAEAEAIRARYAAALSAQAAGGGLPTMEEMAEVAKAAINEQNPFYAHILNEKRIAAAILARLAQPRPAAAAGSDAADARVGVGAVREAACAQLVRRIVEAADKHAADLVADDYRWLGTTELQLIDSAGDWPVVATLGELRAALAEAGPDVEGFQARNTAWMVHAFDGVSDPTNLDERRDRFAEEAMELIQATGGTLDGVIAQARYTFGRPKGEPQQEAGGTLTTLACLLTYARVDMTAAGEAELTRCWAPEVVAKVRRKRANRHGRGVLPGDDADLVMSPPTPAQPDRSAT